MHLAMTEQSIDVYDIINTSGERGALAQSNPGGIGGGMWHLRVQLDRRSEGLEHEGKNSRGDDQHQGEFALRSGVKMDE